MSDRIEEIRARMSCGATFFAVVGAIAVGLALGYLLTTGVLVTFAGWCP